jgi:hypothetical protein
MDIEEMNAQLKRISRFRELNDRADKIRKTINELEGGDDRHSSPFTMDFSEVRKVLDIHVFLSPTRGSGAGVEGMNLWLQSLNIPAYELRKFLLIHLKTELETINEEMKKL